MDKTNILCQNCKGLPNTRSVNRIKDPLIKIKLDIYCFIETRPDEARVGCFCKHLEKWWEWAAILAQGFSAGILILWNHGIGKVTPIALICYTLNLVISTSRPSHWVLSVVYNSQKVHVQRSVLNDLTHSLPHYGRLQCYSFQ